MDGGTDVVRGCVIFEAKHHLGYQLRHIWPDQVRANQLVGARVGDEFHKPVAFAHRPRATVGAEGELADAILAAALLDVALGQSDDGNLGPGVDDIGNGLVVHVRALPCDRLGSNHAFLLGLVGEHWAGHAVADGVHVRHARSHFVVNKDFRASAEVQTDGGGVQAAEGRLATDRDECVVAVQRFLRAISFDLDENAISLAAASDNARAGSQIESLATKNTVAFLDDVIVHAGENRGHELDDSDLRTESAPDGSELEADDTAPDDDEVSGNARNGESADVREDALLVDFEEWELDWYGSRRNDDVLGEVGCDTVFRGGPP